MLDHLTDRRLPAVAAALAMLLALPALLVGYQADDWFHLAVIHDVEPAGGQRPASQAMFSFFDGDPDRTLAMRDAGIVPWWTDLSLRAAFWRPVSIATHQLDQLLAPRVAVVGHVHSLLWFGLLVLLAGLFYRRIHEDAGPVGLQIAGAAALLYAVDEAHGMPVGWLANRNALISGCFGLVVLLLYTQWRRGGQRWAAPVALAVFALGLLTGEAMIATTAYLFAFALFLDTGALFQRLARLVPYAGVVVGWRVVYSAAGYGTEGSGLYLDPVREPARYALALLERAPQLLGDQLLNFPSMLPSFLPAGLRLPVVGLLVLALAPVVVVLARALGRSSTAKFWTVGMVLSLLPVAATFPAPRLLTFVALGGFGLIAEFLVGEASSARRGTRPVGLLLLVLHAAVAPLSLPVQAYVTKPMTELLFNPCEDHAPAGPDADETTLILVNSNDLCASYVRVERAVKGEPSPRVLLLASALYDIAVVGVDEHTIEVEIPAGMQSNPADSLLRNPDDPLALGTTIATPDAAVEILSYNDAGLVDRVEFRFHRRLDHPNHVWLCTVGGEPTPCAPPAPGERLELAGFRPG